MSNVDVNAETEPPPEQEPNADFPCDYPGCSKHWQKAVVAQISVPGSSGPILRWEEKLYLCADHAE